MLLAELSKVNKADLKSVCSHRSVSQALGFERELAGSDDRNKQEFLKVLQISLEPPLPGVVLRRCYVRAATTSWWCACRPRSTEIWVDQVGSVDNLGATVIRPLFDPDQHLVHIHIIDGTR